MKITNIKNVNFSEKELIILYNYIPRIIEKFAILVNLSANYYTNSEQETLLTEDSRGNYWLLATDCDVYFVFPVAKLNGKFNPRVNEAFNLLFEFWNYENSENCQFILKKPARVYPARGQEGWILEETGFLDFGNSQFLSTEAINGTVDDLSLMNENSTSQISRKEFEVYIDKIDKEVDKLKAQVQQLTEAREQIQAKIIEINENYSNLETKLAVQEINSNSSKLQVDASQQEATINQDDSTNIFTRFNLTPEELQIVEIYNSNPVIISQQAKLVAETNSSIEKRIRSNNEVVVLQRQSQGNYWLVSREILYLIPKRGFNLNRSTVDGLKALFKCQGSKVTSKFKLIKPAKVTMIANSQTWELNERGILEFE